MDIKKGDVFVHFKGNVYVVEGFSKDEENRDTQRVLYKDLFSNDLLDQDSNARKTSIFLGNVVRNGKTIKRFYQVHSINEMLKYREYCLSNAKNWNVS